MRYPTHFSADHDQEDKGGLTPFPTESGLPPYLTTPVLSGRSVGQDKGQITLSWWPAGESKEGPYPSGYRVNATLLVGGPGSGWRHYYHVVPTFQAAVALATAIRHGDLSPADLTALAFDHISL